MIIFVTWACVYVCMFIKNKGKMELKKNGPRSVILEVAKMMNA